MLTIESILKNLIKIRTDDKTKSNSECVDYICSVLERYGVCYEIVPVPNTPLYNIVAGINVTALKDINSGIVLSGHMDTVAADPTKWTSNPFQAFEKDGLIYGRGTVDMKQFIAITLALIPEIQKTNKPVLLVFSCDEETDVMGIREISAFLKERNIIPQYALIGEPTGFDLCVANRGYAGYTTRIDGVSCHSGTPNLGTNALYIAAKIASKIEELNRVYMPKGATLNVGMLSGGQCRNAVAGHAMIDWEIRYEQEYVFVEIQKQAEQMYVELKQMYPNAQITTSETENLPSFEKNKTATITRIAQNILGSKTLTLPYATEAGFFQKMGIETLVCGAGDEKLAHTDIEHIAIADLNKYAAFLIAFLNKI